MDGIEDNRPFQEVIHADPFKLLVDVSCQLDGFCDSVDLAEVPYRAFPMARNALFEFLCCFSFHRLDVCVYITCSFLELFFLSSEKWPSLHLVGQGTKIINKGLFCVS